MACRRHGTCFSPLPVGWLSLLLAPVFPALSPAPLDVLVGSPVSLSIPFPLPATQILTSITWRQNGTSIALGNLRPNFTVVIAPQYKPRFSVDPVWGNLSITKANLFDSGFYMVEVNQLSNTPQTANFTLRVYEQVGNITVSLSSPEVIEGNGSVILTCHPIHGTVLWTKDGKTLPENPRYFISGGFLKINQILQNDAGVYCCTVSNPFGNATATAQLTVYYGPKTPTITISSSSDQDPEDGNFVLVNSSVNLTCLASSLPPALIYWSVADIQNPNVPSLPVLQLRRVQLNQAGMYSCLAINQYTHHSVRNTRNLVVAQRPSGAPLCSVTSANNGTALLFDCSWLGGSPVPYLTFQGLPGGLQEGVNASTLQRLLAPAGLNGTKVTCLGRHLTGKGNCSIIPEAPSGVFLSLWAYNDTGGRVTVELHCQGSFNPVEVTWFQDGGPLVSTSVGGRYQLSSDRTRLTIWNFTVPKDLGTYSVNCSNPLGSQYYNLTVIGPTITEWTLSHGSYPGSASMSWTVPNGSAVTSFQIQMQDSKQNRMAEEWKTVLEVGSTNRSTTLEGLDPQTSYTFRIVPRLGFEIGNSSSVQILKPLASHLSAGAIAGIVIGSICGFLLLIALIVLLIICLQRRRETKAPPTPPENRQHYLSRQFPNGNTLETNDPSWGNPRWSAGDSDIYAITYEKHLFKYGVPATLPAGTMNGGINPPVRGPVVKNIRTATQV